MIDFAETAAWAFIFAAIAYALVARHGGRTTRGAAALAAGIAALLTKAVLLEFT